MRLISRTAVSLLILLLLGGCWDQQLLKSSRIIHIGGFDRGEGDKLKVTVAFPDVSSNEGGRSETNEIHTVTSNTTQQARGILDHEISGNYSPSKLLVLLLSEEWARAQDIMPYMDVYYRDPKSPLNAHLAVVNGTAEGLIRLEKVGTKLIGRFLNELLENMEDGTVIPRINFQTIGPVKPGQDFALPYVSIHSKKPVVQGVALFHSNVMTASLSSEESLIYLLLKGQKGKTARLTLPVNTGEEEEHEAKADRYITVDLHKYSRKMKVELTESGGVRVKIRLKINAAVIEYPPDRLNKKETLQKLDEELSRLLTARAKAITRKMQEANHDGYGVALRLMAFHPEAWKKMNWEEDYKEVQFEPDIRLKIERKGITF
ncbi:Ger(x)C family spore germination protein [Paenibacillus chitinolyticus]|uniref:Ger(x)C family spore germination protein n=1 Tax=Paenibacillus chitinolyticus TaxID=79263 RepID=UPI002DBCDB64|nr:Ger(x)C family spore germination protein [Paenibacillus chitinolyticus]MEC0248911.1 Ger(x)C family spore germination protein [Paenibacillus chitinolyticus]